MRAKFAIDRHGVVVNTTDRPNRRSYIHVERRGQLLQISLNRYAPVPALLALIRHIRMVEGRISLRTELPILGDRKRLTNLDTPSALAKLDEAQMRPMAFFYPNSELKMMLAKPPSEAVWPRKLPESKQLVAEIVPEPFALWLQIAYETSLSVRQPLLHFGHMLLPSAQERKDELQPFRRLIMPISAKTERPSNYRVLTAAIRLSDGAWIL